MRQGFFTALFALALTAGLTVGAAAASYTDVAAGAWYYDAVTKVTRDGLMNGTSETTFSPETPVTRGMVAAVLWRLAGSPAPADRSSFPDVEGWYYYADAAAWCAQQSIAAGYGDGSFGGGDIVTREQLAVFLWRYAQYAGLELAAGVLDIYPDRDGIHTWAREGMAHAVGAGLITGRDGNRLDPGGPGSRAQLAVILRRLTTPAVG